MIRKGTTPTHIFNVNIDTEDIASVKVLYAQDGKLVLKKDTDSVKIENGKIMLTLTQEDTLLFDYRKPAQIQLRILTNSGTALASGIIPVSVGQLLESEAIT